MSDSVLMTAAAHSLDDEPQPDSAEAELPAADFRIIERAHEICGHPAARELAANCLIAPAVKILSAQIRASELLRELKERGERCDVEDFIEIDDDETDEVKPAGIDWAQVAQAAWDGASWKQAAQEYRAKRVRR